MERCMKIRMVAAILGCVALFEPTFVMAQASRGSSVGIVTTLAGEATVTRADRPAQALPLKFKDEVYFKDRISTKEHSITRVLLGGKSLVTVRELSDLTITEEPGRPSILDLFGGKIAMAVAKLRMRPGESIEVRTPNAVAAVRGTVLVVDVTIEDDSQPKPRLTSFFGGATPVQSKNVKATFYNISTSPDSFVDVKPLSGKAQLPGGVTIGPGQFVASDIFGLGQPGIIPPNQMSNILAGMTGGLMGGKPSDQLTEQHMNITNGTFGGNGQALDLGNQNQDQNQDGDLYNSGTCPPNCLPPPPPPFVISGHLTPCDDCTTNADPLDNDGVPGVRTPGAPIPLEFTFPFSPNGTNYTHIEISSNGFFYLIDPTDTEEHDDGCCSGSASELRSGLPRIAPFWTDLYPLNFLGEDGEQDGTGTVTFTRFPGRAVVSWNNVSECCDENAGTTFQAQIMDDGKIIFTYSSINITDHTALVGVSPGEGVGDPGQTIFSSLDIPTNKPGTVYQIFELCDGECDTFDLIGKFIMFTPDGEGGWIVVDPPPPYLVALGNGETVVRDRPLLEATGGSQLLIGGAALIENGQLIVTDPGPLVSLTGGTHHLGIFPGTAMFELMGQATAVDPETGLEVGTHQPLVHAGELLELNGARAGAEQLVRVDRALLEATAPLLNMMNGSAMVSNNDLVNLTNHARMTANLLPGDALVKLNTSSLTVNSGSLFNVGGGSVFNVTGSLVSLANGSLLNILNGGLLSVSGGSFANITGSLVSFLGAGNSLTINNNFAPTSIINGIPVFTSGGATVSITNPTPITGVGTQNIHGSLIIAQGAGTSVTVR